MGQREIAGHGVKVHLRERKYKRCLIASKEKPQGLFLLMTGAIKTLHVPPKIYACCAISII